MISCADSLTQLSDYVEGDVADELRLQLEMHLSHCRSCTVLVDSTRKTIRILTDADCFWPPENVCSVMSERIIGRIQKRVVVNNEELSSVRRDEESVRVHSEPLSSANVAHRSRGSRSTTRVYGTYQTGSTGPKGKGIRVSRLLGRQPEHVLRYGTFARSFGC
jgi:hypothetical protein